MTASVRTMPTRRPYVLLGVFAIFVTAFLALTGAQPASAHDSLVASSPEPGEVFDTAPSAIELTFSEDVIEVGSVIELVDHHGEQVEIGETVVLGPEVSATLPADLDGEYQARWKVVSSDGHPIEGTIDFGVGPDATGVWTSEAPHDDAEAGDEASDPTEDAPAVGDESDDVSVAPISAAVGQWAVPLFIVAAIVIVGLIVTVILLARRRPPGAGPEAGAGGRAGSGGDAGSGGHAGSGDDAGTGGDAGSDSHA